MKKILMIVAVLTLFNVSSLAQASKLSPQSPMDAIKELDLMVDEYRVGGDKISKEDEKFNQELKSKILRGTFNLRYLAELALHKNWDQLSKKEQQKFVELLTSLLEERSIFAKEQASKNGEGRSYEIKYKKETYLNQPKTKAVVETAVNLKKHKTKLELHYKLRKELNGKWQIYDVIVDDASLVDNYRYSFGTIIKKHGYPELVKRMENKLKDFRSQRS
ncbi:MAG: ABC transporter substrate-binding protein [Deltaproteobacteria bacterium]|nr:ABC transporter substrate-binding protein [Deltaproteobacteria bacterium]